VLDVLEPERSALVELLNGLGPEDWAHPTECPSCSIKGIAAHLLGDDLSLLSRQRDEATDGTTLLA
jgi:mycothiol maleylpyruvate isomerase-like protein